MHSTNYLNTLITIADDCPVDHGAVPPAKEENPSIAGVFIRTKDGCIALYAVDSTDYATLATGEQLQKATDDKEDSAVTVVKAMRSSRR